MGRSLFGAPGPDGRGMVFGGKYLVYAPDGQQQFPSDFGADKKLFTDDDPIMDLPAGWSVIDMDQSPFGVDRSEKPTIDLAWAGAREAQLEFDERLLELGRRAL